MSEHTATPWAADPDTRAGMEWNVHIVEAANLDNRVCFMTSGPEGEINAAHIVKCVNAHEALVNALEEIRNTPFSMVNDSESLRHTIRVIQHISGAALASLKESI
jgi:hypothetical protein